MKSKFLPNLNDNSAFANKENLNPLLGYNSKNIELKKKPKENFFDEMDQLLNADFWKKNINKTNYPSNYNSNENYINMSMDGNNLASNKIFKNNKNNDNFKQNNNNNNVQNRGIGNSNLNSLINNIRTNIRKTLNLYTNKSSNFNDENFFNSINQKNINNNLNNNFSIKNNILNNKNVNIYESNKKENQNLNLSNLETGTKNRISRLNNNNVQLNYNNYFEKNKSLNDNIKSEKNDLEIINSQELQAAFGSDIESSPHSSPKKINKENDFFKQPIYSLMKQYPLSSIINFPTLNKVQEECFDLLYKTNERALITSPTGSGKTLLFELGIARVIKQNYNIAKNSYENKNFKIIYIAPIKSLCQEKTFEWKMKYSKSPLELNVTEYTSDSEYLNISLLNKSNIILTTPEKFDVLTRKWKKISNFISNISLLLIDEIHLLNDESRGATLEAIIARIKLLKSMENFKETNLENIRIIAVSATIPNISDVAEFLEVKQGLKIFGEEYRPVKVERIVIGYKRNKNQNEFVFEKYLDYRVSGIIEKYSEGKPTLIFCQTQKNYLIDG